MTVIEFQYQLVKLQKCLRNFAFRLTSDIAAAKDLVQETFQKALKLFDTYVCEANIKVWTFAIMKNTFLNNYYRTVRCNIQERNSRQNSR